MNQYQKCPVCEQRSLRTSFDGITTWCVNPACEDETDEE
jgi:hypothetical protein